MPVNAAEVRRQDLASTSQTLPLAPNCDDPLRCIVEKRGEISLMRLLPPSIVARWVVLASPRVGGWLFPLAVAIMMFVLPPFFRDIRPVAAFLAFPLLVSAMGAFVGLVRSTVLTLLLTLVAVMLLALAAQSAFGYVPDLMLALRQQFYYGYCLIGTIVAAFMVLHYRHQVFGGMSLLLAAGLYGALSLGMDAEFAGDFDIRGNFESGTVFFTIGYMYWAHGRPLRLVAGLVTFLLLSVYTHSAQGILFSLLALSLLPFGRVIRGVALAVLGSVPILFPIVLPLIVELIGGIDNNVTIRQEIWSALFSYLAEDYGFLGFGFGIGTYQAAFEHAMINYIHFARLENIGMHNGILQLAAFIGIIGLAFGVLLLFVLAGIAIRHADDMRVVASYLILILSLTLNQAFTHLAVALGTVLALGVMATAEWAGRKLPAS